MRCALFLATLGACACLTLRHAEPPRNRTTRWSSPKPFAVPDETMQFRVRFRGLTVGIVQTAIGHDGWIGERPAIIVRSRGHSDGIAAMFGSLVWELTTTLDLDHALPIDDHEEAWIEFAGKQDHEDDHHTWRAGRSPPRRALGDRLLARLAQQARRSYPGRDPDRRRLVRDRSLGRRSRALGIAADKPAVRYEGLVDRRVHFTIWLSDDSARVPLAFRCDTQFGMIAVDLVDYEVPPG